MTRELEILEDHTHQESHKNTGRNPTEEFPETKAGVIHYSCGEKGGKGKRRTGI